MPGLPRRSIDIAFPRQRLAVFIDGCFWHGCSTHKTIPARNRSAWNEKIEATRLRDQGTTQYLTDAGWTVLRFWEHVPAGEVAASILEALGDSELVPSWRGREQ